jgi:hypothetical protein
MSSLNVPFEVMISLPDGEKDVWLASSIFFVCSVEMINRGMTDRFIENLTEFAKVMPWVFAPFAAEARFISAALEENAKKADEAGKAIVDKTTKIFDIIGSCDDNEERRGVFLEAWNAIGTIYVTHGSEVTDMFLADEIIRLETQATQPVN